MARSSRALTSRFKPWLTSPEAMRQALEGLLTDADRYSVFIRLPRNAQAGSQAKTLTLFEDDAIDLTSSLDPRLVRSRNVKIVFASKTGGAAEVNLTARRWEILQDSPPIRAKLATFEAALRSGKRSRFVSPGYLVSALTFPIWFLVLMITAWLLGDPTNRKFATNPKSPSSAPLPVPFPHWYHDVALVVIVSWPLWIFAGLMIGATYYLSGGLLVWPEVMTFASATKAIHNVRVGLFTLANFNLLVVTVVGGIICTLFGFILAHIFH